MAWIILVEWDGKKPPSGFYRRLRAMAARGVRGDKSVPALERRMAADRMGIVVQEGAILVPSESLARFLAMLAHRYGAAYVQVGQVHLTEHMAPSPEDAEAMRRVEALLGRKGRKPAKRVWTVVCYECLTVHRVEAAAPLNCPTCGGVWINICPGEPPRYRDPGTDLWDAWLRTRFAVGQWLPAGLDGRAPLPPTQVTLPQGKGKLQVVTAQMQRVDWTHHLAVLDRETSLQVLDAIYAARARWPKERRLAARLAAATAYFQRGGDPAKITLAEGDIPDLLDAAGPLGAEGTASLLLLLLRGGGA